ncbi:GTPase ObgE [Peptoniphilus sp. GNH]|nr:GTPase ObgE [Peptoniphilus sp. GNH]
MFIDRAKIKVIAGSGGDGAVAWRREKYVPAGGPAGGDGGHGGNVIIKTDEGLHTLLDFRYKREYKAENGDNGQSKLKFGKDGQDIVLSVPVGTLVKDAESGKVIHDLKAKNMEIILARGGRGGKGNARFKTATRQAPTFAQAGKKGESRSIILELKILADVGLVGFPNVGKSTLLSVVSAAKPKIANYHFTTLSPNLGMVFLGDQKSFVIADIPGLIEGASKGQGLGDEFLKHVERTKVLIHVVDISGSEGRDPLDDFDKINKELEDYNEKLAKKPQIIFLNKIDLSDSSGKVKEFEDKFGKGYKIFSGSAYMNKGIKELMYYAYDLLQKQEDDYETYDEEYVETEDRAPAFEVYKENGNYFVDGPYIDLLLRSTNFNSRESLRYFQENLRKNKIVDRLKELGVGEGESVFIGEYEFEFFE